MPRSRPSLRGRFSRPSLWVALVPVVALVAGLLFATSGRTAQGTDLRAGDNSQLSEVIEQRNRSVARQQQELARLQAEAQRLTKQAASRNGGVADAQAQGEPEHAAAGLTGGRDLLLRGQRAGFRHCHRWTHIYRKKRLCRRGRVPAV